MNEWMNSSTYKQSLKHSRCRTSLQSHCCFYPVCYRMIYLSIVHTLVLSNTNTHTHRKQTCTQLLGRCSINETRRRSLTVVFPLETPVRRTCQHAKHCLLINANYVPFHGLHQPLDCPADVVFWGIRNQITWVTDCKNQSTTHFGGLIDVRVSKSVCVITHHYILTINIYGLHCTTKHWKKSLVSELPFVTHDTVTACLWHAQNWVTISS